MQAGDPTCRTETETAGLLLPLSTSASVVARDFVRRTACREHCLDQADLLLLVSEVVTNALRHGQPPMTLTLGCHIDRTVVAVRDRGPGMPAPPTKAPEPEAQSGRGLWLVTALAEAWGVWPRTVPGLGKTVWFELRNEPR